MCDRLTPVASYILLPRRKPHLPWSKPADDCIGSCLKAVGHAMATLCSIFWEWEELHTMPTNVISELVFFQWHIQRSSATWTY